MMMIRNVVASTLTTFAVLCASSSSSVVSATDSSLRGSQNKNDPDHRSLVGLDEMVCEPTDDGQGSVMCTFRMVPPSTTDNINQYNYCMSDGNGDEFCLKTEVFRKYTPRASLEIISSSVESVPATAAASTEFFDDGTDGVGDNTGYTIVDTPPTPVAETQPAPIATAPVETAPAPIAAAAAASTAMNCPRFKPTSGEPCGGWLFAGSNYGSCLFGESFPTSCNCDNRAGHNDAKNIYWICDGDGYFPMAAVAAIDITANVNTIQGSTATAEASVAAATAAASSTNTAGTINVPTPINDALCPINTPADGSPCVELKRCGYWDRPVEPTKLIDCRCDTYQRFHCRDADQALYGYYSFSSF